MSKFKISQTACWVAASVLLLSLSGCGDHNAKKRDLQHFIASEKQKPAGRIAPMPKHKPQQQFAYSASLLRSPFNAPRVAEDEQPDKHRPKEALENFQLDALRMVGVMKNGKDMWALVQAPNGIVYRVKAGNYIGQNYGRIEEVNKLALLVVEKVKHGQGEWMQRESKLKLRADEAR